MSDQLSKLRQQIQQIDEQILELLAARLDLVKTVGEVKKAANMPILNQTVFNQKLTTLKTLAAQYNLPQEFVTEIWETIHRQALKIQT